MASRAFRELESLADRRRGLRSELDKVDADLRVSAVEAVRSGVPAAPAARLAGVSRETLYKWLRAQGVATDTLQRERILEARIAALEGDHEARVRDVMGAVEPAGDLSTQLNWRSGYQIEQMGRKTSRGERSALEVYRFHAELGLEDSDVEAELDACKGELLAIRDARIPF